MFKTAEHTKNTKHILLMCFILFALSPCIVKEVLFGSAIAEYSKSLNKSKTTTQTNPCSYSQGENQHISVVKQRKANKQIEPVDFIANQLYVVRSVKILNKYSKTFSGNSPPKYILYKRLKLDIA